MSPVSAPGNTQTAWRETDRRGDFLGDTQDNIIDAQYIVITYNTILNTIPKGYASGHETATVLLPGFAIN